MLKSKNDVLLLLFVLSFLKSLVLRPTVYESLILLATGLVYSYLEYKNADKKILEVQQLINQQREELLDIKDKVSTIKITQQVKPSAVSFRV